MPQYVLDQNAAMKSRIRAARIELILREEMDLNEVTAEAIGEMVYWSMLSEFTREADTGAFIDQVSGPQTDHLLKCVESLKATHRKLIP